MRSAQCVGELVGPPFQQQPGVGDRDRVVGFGADFADAGRDAALDVVLQARPRPLSGDDLVTRPDAEQAVRERHGPAGQACRQERSREEVGRALLDPPRHQHPRKGLAGGQPQVGVVLVVPEQDVVARRALLDQVVLERQRLHHRIGDDDFERGDLGQQRVVPRAGAPGPQVTADAIPQGSGLSDVDRLPARISPQVDAGLFRQTRDLVSEILDGHGLDGLV